MPLCGTSPLVCQLRKNAKNPHLRFATTNRHQKQINTQRAVHCSCNRNPLPLHPQSCPKLPSGTFPPIFPYPPPPVWAPLSGVSPKHLCYGVISTGAASGHQHRSKNNEKLSTPLLQNLLSLVWWCLCCYLAQNQSLQKAHRHHSQILATRQKLDTCRCKPLTFQIQLLDSELSFSVGLIFRQSEEKREANCDNTSCKRWEQPSDGTAGDARGHNPEYLESQRTKWKRSYMNKSCVAPTALVTVKHRPKLPRIGHITHSMVCWLSVVCTMTLLWYMALYFLPNNYAAIPPPLFCGLQFNYNCKCHMHQALPWAC